jgi:hypothetical protein
MKMEANLRLYVKRGDWVCMIQKVDHSIPESACLGQGFLISTGRVDGGWKCLSLSKWST